MMLLLVCISWQASILVAIANLIVSPYIQSILVVSPLFKDLTLTGIRLNTVTLCMFMKLANNYVCNILFCNGRLGKVPNIYKFCLFTVID